MTRNGIPDVKGTITWELEGLDGKSKKPIFKLDDKDIKELPDLY